MISHQSVGQAHAANRRTAHFALAAALTAAMASPCGAFSTLPSLASARSLGASSTANSRPSLARWVPLKHISLSPAPDVLESHLPSLSTTPHTVQRAHLLCASGFPFSSSSSCPYPSSPSSLSMRDRSGRQVADPEEQPTTHVSSPGGGLVEVGSLDVKRDFTVTEHLLSEIPDHMNFEAGVPTGTMSLVGAGPGDPDLLTMAALKELQKADLVVSDRLVSAEILSLVKCELRIAHKNPGCATQAQREIYRWCFEALMKGKRVVRLKIGDPFVFGRGGEEVAEFRRFGVEPTVVPGISSALAGPMAAMIPVTHRGVANKVAFCTGMDRNEDTPAVPVYDKEQTVVFLMAVGRLRELCEMMVKQGYPKGTPVGIIERATTPQQREVIGTLDEIADVAEEKSVRAPAIVVVGEVVRALGSSGSKGDAAEQSFALEWLADHGLLELPGQRK